MAPTLRDIAKKAKVSSTVVSDILNRGRGGKYSEATIASVRQIAGRLGYEANQAAKALKSGKTGTIGIVDPYGLINHQVDPYFEKIMVGVGGRTAAAGYASAVFSVEDQADDLSKFPEGLYADGLIYVVLSLRLADFKKNFMPRIKKQSVPSVVLHALTVPFSCPSVGLDCERGGYAVTDHLIRKHGYDDIAFLANNYPYPHHQNMFSGFKRAMADGGLPVKRARLLTCNGYNARAGYAAIDTYIKLDKGLPRAIVTVADTLAHGAIRRLREEGIRVPEDVAVTGFGNDVNEGFLYSGLTTVNQLTRERGAAAVEMLLDRIGGKTDENKSDQVVLEPELLVRETCGCKNSIS